MTKKQRNNIKGLSVVVPITLYFAIFTLVPLVMLFIYSMKEYSIVDRLDNFIWFDNFVQAFTRPDLLFSLLSTFIIAILVLGLGMTLGFILAYLLNKLSFGKGLLRTVWYIPALISMAILSVLLNVLLKPSGSLNTLFEAFGLPAQSWYKSPFWMFFWIIAIVSWRGLGGTALLFIAGLNGIDKQIYEAADIDGCAGFTRIFRITLPLMRPMLGYILITGFIGAFNIFEPVQLISQGGPDEWTKVILYRIYDAAFNNNAMGFASALSVIVFVIVLVLTFFNMKMTDDSLLSTKKK